MSLRVLSFEPGDRITKTPRRGTPRTYVVDDPAYTSRGKVRYRSEAGSGVQTAWWTPESVDSREGWSWERPRRVRGRCCGIIREHGGLTTAAPCHDCPEVVA